MANSTPSGPLLPIPAIRCQYLEEPSLLFAGAREHVSARMGITLFGPRSLDMPERHPLTTKVGLIGSGVSIESAARWLETCLDGVEGNEQNDAFPGYTENVGFYASLSFSKAWNEIITQHDLATVVKPHRLKDRFLLGLELIVDKLRLLSQKDQRPDYIILALPDALLDHCQVVDYTDPELGNVHRDFRRALKAAAMKYNIPTQILRQKTSEATPDSRNVDHKSRVAWNFFSSLYFKAGGIPWSPKGLEPGTCFIGISFYRPLGSASNVLCTSVAQAFDEHGNGLVLRGPDFQWDVEKFGRSPHLNEQQAKDLIDLVLKRYKDEMKQLPSRVVVHKSSRFWPAESEGFQGALTSVRSFDLVAVRPNDRVRLIREGQYPPLRGTAFNIDMIQYLYTTGFIPALKAYPHGHVPSPLQIADHIGDSPLSQILEELLVLTKMNWNTTAFADLRPITLRFSQLVGDIMREIPAQEDPAPAFKFYM